MNNEKKVINYMKKETNFNGSFKDIENRINFQNIVIRDDKNKFKFFKNGFDRLKIAFLCLACSIVCFVGGFKLAGDYIGGFEVIYTVFEYDTYAQFEEAVYNYEELYPEQKLKVFDIDLGGNYTYEYKIKGELKYKNNDMNNVISFDRRIPYIELNENINQFTLFFLREYHGGGYVSEKWINETFNYELDENNNKNELPFLRYIFNVSNNNLLSNFESYISDHIHLLEV